MKKFNKIQFPLLQNLSEELAIDISFLEKDYYVTQVLYILSCLKDDKFRLIFSGGTCLSKAYNVTKRFSEDIDLRIHEKIISSREERKNFINKILELINKNENFKVISIKKEDTSHRIIIDIEYKHIAENNLYLRPEIKLELFFCPVKLKMKEKEIMTLADRYTKNSENIFKIHCINIIELAAEKYSALLWRILYSSKKDYDPTLIRHLYDLAMLKDTILQNRNLFAETLQNIYNQDKIKRDKDNKFDSIKEAFEQLYNLFKSEKIFNKFYQAFVQNMCYDLSSNAIKFEQTIKTLKDISMSIF